MDEATLFEQRFEDRVRAFARTGVRPVDSAAVARAVATGHPRRTGGGTAVRRLGLVLNRRMLVIGVALCLLIALLTLSVLVVGGRPPAVTQDPAINPNPAVNPGPAPRVNRGLVTPRSGAVAVTLTDGHVLILGGRGATEGNRTALASAELYDPATGRFTETGSMTEPREQPLATRLLDGKVLVVGGRSETADLASAEIYDPATGTFAAVGSMPFARAGCHCGINFLAEVRPTMTVLANGRVMVVGGRDAALEPAARADLFDPETGQFTSSAPIACDVSRGTVTGLPDGRALVTCRADDGSPTSPWQARAFIYDAASDTFVPTGSPTTNDSGIATLLTDGRVLLTGRGERFVGGPAELYDPTIGAFTPVGDQPDLMPITANPSPYALRVALDTGLVLFLVPDGSRSLIFDPAGERMTPYEPWPGGAAADLGGGRVLLIPGSPDTRIPSDPTVIDLSGFLPTDATKSTPSAAP